MSKTPIPTQMQTLAHNKAYTLAAGNDSADLQLYGDIVESQPTDWFGDPIEGDFITLDGFLSDLEQVKKKKCLTLHLSSYGGDAGVSNMIHNKLRELARDGMEITCIVDGVAMSGGSLIMCAADTVRVNPSSLIMIHKCWSLTVGCYNADELREMARTQDAWDKAQIEIYQRKTGLSKTVIEHMMSDTTYMTGREAVEKGFADELIEDEPAVTIAASANRKNLFVNGHRMRIIPGTILPENIPIQQEKEPEPAPKQVNPATKADGNITPEPSGKGGTPMTLEELRAQYPELVAEVEAGAQASGASDAAKAERERIAAIDEVASLFPADLVNAAKYGDKPMTAQELSYQAAIRSAKEGKQFLANLKIDSNESGANEVAPAPAPSVAAPEMTMEADAARTMEMYLNTRKEVH